MKTKTITKENFDAVKTMREIRDQISKEIMNMTYAEEKAYLKKLLSKKPVKASQKLSVNLTIPRLLTVYVYF